MTNPELGASQLGGVTSAPIIAGPISTLTGAPVRISAAVSQLYQACGPWAAADTNGHLLGLCEGLGGLVQVIDDLCRDNENGPGWSQIVDVNRAPTYVLPWLGQLVGVNVDQSLSDIAQRDQIIAEQGFARGTIAAIVASLKPFLTNYRVVRVTERAGGDAYALGLTVFTRDLVGGRWTELVDTYATWASVESAYANWNAIGVDVDAELLAALTAAKPAGLVATLTIASGGDWTDVTNAYASWNSVLAQFATWNALLAFTPPT